jgi:hypothetical protein
MAGTLTISTLSDGTNSTSSTNCIQGSAKAWVNFDGATPTIAGSYNVTSITRNSTGNYTVNFTNSLANANYAVSASTGAQTGVGTGEILVDTFTTSNFKIRTFNSSGGTSFDFNPICASVFI